MVKFFIKLFVQIIIFQIFSLQSFSAFAFSEVVSIPSYDGFQIKGDFFSQEEKAPGVIVLHQCNIPVQQNRKTFEPLGEKLHAAGFNVLLVDFRGFGESVSEDFKISIEDINLAFKQRGEAFFHFKEDSKAVLGFFQEKENVDPNHVGIIGSSCGGSMATLLATETENIQSIVLLSAFLGEVWIKEHHWDTIENSKTSILSIAAEEDNQQGIFDSAKRVFLTSNSGKSKLISYKGAAHGAPLFALDPSLELGIVSWLKETLKNNDE